MLSIKSSLVTLGLKCSLCCIVVRHAYISFSELIGREERQIIGAVFSHLPVVFVFKITFRVKSSICLQKIRSSHVLLDGFGRVSDGIHLSSSILHDFGVFLNILA